MVTKDDLKLANIIWDYMNVNNPDPPISDIILCLGSIDTLPAEKSAELYLKGKAPLIVFSGKSGRNSKYLKSNKSEAQILANVAIKKGVPQEAILIEEKSTNTGQNFRYSKNLLAMKGIKVKRLIVSHMPSSLKRDYLIFKKQWREPQPEIFMVSPDIPLEKYYERGFSGKFTLKEVIKDMLGDFQRIKVGFDKGHSAYEEIPEKIKNIYYKLVEKNYTKQLIKDKKGNPLPV